METTIVVTVAIYRDGVKARAWRTSAPLDTIDKWRADVLADVAGVFDVLRARPGADAHDDKD